jgi:hypothetical protein
VERDRARAPVARRHADRDAERRDGPSAAAAALRHRGDTRRRGTTDRGFDRAALDRHGYYSQQYLLCTDASWEHAVDLLLARPSIVLMDLVGFSAEHRGCITEIRRLFSQVALARCTFLADPTTDMQFVEKTMREAWASRSASSPNTGPGVVRIMQLQNEMKAEGRDLDASDANVARILKVLCMSAAESGLVTRAVARGNASQ